MKILDAMWFNSVGGTCGLVIGEDEHTGEKKAYIGVVHGFDEKLDTVQVAEYGCKVDLTMLTEIVKKLGIIK